MAKTKQSAEPKELDRTILVDGQPYNINAVESNQVKNALIIKNIGLTGNEKVSERVEFTGNTAAEVSIVSADTGGRFNKEIRVPNATNVGSINEESVLNYSDIVSLVLNKIQKGAIYYSWDGTTATPSKEIAEPNTFNYISIVVGENSPNNLPDKPEGFASWNYNQKLNSKTPYVPIYLYIEQRNDKNDCITYFGNADSETAVKLAINSAEEVKVANKAKQLETPRKITADLSGDSNDNTFDGSKNESIGVTGKLPSTYLAGNISKDLLDEDIQDSLKLIAYLIDGTRAAAKATRLDNFRTIQTKLNSTTAASFDGTANVTPGVTGVLGAANGGTGNNFGGSASLHIGNNVYKDGTYFQPKILTGTVDPKDDVTAQKAVAGTIYIKYKET